MGGDLAEPLVGRRFSPSKRQRGVGHFAVLTLGATGVVFGDIGTSPLYVFQSIYNEQLHAQPSEADIVGTFACIFWAMSFIVCVKYVGIVMRVNHHGEGGTFALLQTILSGSPTPLGPRAKATVTFVAMLGCSLLLGDGAITPAMSVLGALEGLPLESLPRMPISPEAVRTLIAALVIVGIFSVQRHGSRVIGLVAGPVMVLWFLTIGGLGVRSITLHPAAAARVAEGFHPRALYTFFAVGRYRGVDAWRSLGGVVLCVTGAEALYADMAHFGAAPITATWLALVYPSLVIQYAGQATHLIAHASEWAETHPFYSAVPSTLQWPVLGLATLAACIASQALISGVFTLLAQAHALEFIPRIRVLHTSEKEKGQVYIPEVGRLLGLVCVTLVLAFRSTDRLSAAYGIAVTGDALVTTCLLSVVVWRVWGWRLLPWAVLLAPLCCVDVLFWTSNLVKLGTGVGGWMPVLLAASACLAMHTHYWGRLREKKGLARAADEELRALDTPQSSDLMLAGTRAHHGAAPAPALPRISTAEALVKTLRLSSLTRTDATAVFLTPYVWKVPQSLSTVARALNCLPATLVLLTVKFVSVPFVDPADRATFDPFDVEAGVYRVVLHFGYAEPLSALRRVRSALAQVAALHVATYPALRDLALTVNVDLDADDVAAGMSPAQVRPEEEGAAGKGPGQELGPRMEGEPHHVTFFLNRFNYVTRAGHSRFTKARIALYRRMVLNQREPMRFFGLPPTRTIEVSSVRYL